MGVTTVLISIMASTITANMIKAKKHNKCCCDMCKAKEIMDGLKWENRIGIGFDDDEKEILVEEDLLMHYIQLANPIQPKRKIRLVKNLFKG